MTASSTMTGHCRSGSFLPLSRITASTEDGNDSHGRRFEDEEDAVGEPAGQYPRTLRCTGAYISGFRAAEAIAASTHIRNSSPRPSRWRSYQRQASDSSSSAAGRTRTEWLILWSAPALGPHPKAMLRQGPLRERPIGGPIHHGPQHPRALDQDSTRYAPTNPARAESARMASFSRNRGCVAARSSLRSSTPSTTRINAHGQRQTRVDPLLRCPGSPRKKPPEPERRAPGRPSLPGLWDCSTFIREWMRGVTRPPPFLPEEMRFCRSTQEGDITSMTHTPGPTHPCHNRATAHFRWIPRLPPPIRPAVWVMEAICARHRRRGCEGASLEITRRQLGSSCCGNFAMTSRTACPIAGASSVAVVQTTSQSTAK